MDPISPITMRRHLPPVVSLDRPAPVQEPVDSDAPDTGEARPPLTGTPQTTAPIGRWERLLAQRLRG